MRRGEHRQGTSHHARTRGKGKEAAKYVEGASLYPAKKKEPSAPLLTGQRGGEREGGPHEEKNLFHSFVISRKKRGEAFRLRGGKKREGLAISSLSSRRKVPNEQPSRSQEGSLRKKERYRDEPSFNKERRKA